MSTVLRGCELVADLALEVWAESAGSTARLDAARREENENVAELRARLARCRTELQRVHEIDARIDLLRATPQLEGRDRCIDRLTRLRATVLRAARRRSPP